MAAQPLQQTSQQITIWNSQKWSSGNASEKKWSSDFCDALPQLAGLRIFCFILTLVRRTYREYNQLNNQARLHTIKIARHRFYYQVCQLYEDAREFYKDGQLRGTLNFDEMMRQNRYAMRLWHDLRIKTEHFQRQLRKIESYYKRWHLKSSLKHDLAATPSLPKFV